MTEPVNAPSKLSAEDINILVVDDVGAMRILIKSMLMQMGYRTISEVDSGESAKKVLSSTPNFHVIISDWHMSPTTGLDLLRFTRAHPAYGKVPFIFCTAEGTTDFVRTAIQTGADDYILKPFSIEFMETRIKDLLTRKGLLK